MNNRKVKYLITFWRFFVIVCILFFGQLFVPSTYAQLMSGNWSFIGTFPSGTFQDFVIDPNNQNISYLATDNGLYKSINGGINWTSLYSDTRITRVAVFQNNSNIIYASSFGDGPVLKCT